MLNIKFTRNKGRTFFYYALMLIAALFALVAIHQVGKRMGLEVGMGNAVQSHSQINTLLHVLLAMATVIIAARVVGGVFRFIHQPAVIGEVVGGVLLGPSFLGQVAPEVSHFLLPPEAAPLLGVIAQIGIILYMFIVGLELDLSILRKSGHATLAISHASIIVPFLLGAGSALWLYRELAQPGSSFTPFALFLGISMSVTAFPVLARILADRKVQKTRMGTVALTCAAVDDVTAWCLLAFVVSVSQAKIGGAIATFVLTLVYISAMLLVGRPLMKRLVPALEAFDRITEGGMALIVVLLLVSALLTEVIGIHALFGAFLLGAITPPDSRVANDFTDRLEDLVRVLFLPAFFAFTGMRTQVALLDNQRDWKICGLLILIATLGKFGGTFVAGRLTGLAARESAALGILMNTRGLVELIVLNIGLDMGIIAPRLFTMLVIMALVTTFMTTPVLALLTRKAPWKAAS